MLAGANGAAVSGITADVWMKLAGGKSEPERRAGSNDVGEQLLERWPLAGLAGRGQLNSSGGRERFEWFRKPLR